MPSSDQVELIADQFAAISNEYDPLLTDDITVPDMTASKPCPFFEPYQIYQKIKKMKKKASTLIGDILWRIILEYSAELSDPLRNIYNPAMLDGVWPDVWKCEYVTPAQRFIQPTQ